MPEDVAAALTNATGFEWDAGNASRVITRHNVQPGECEQTFFAEPFLVSFDEKHSTTEPRWQALGRTSADRWLFLVVTVRGTMVRVLTAREMNRKERVSYGEVKARIA